MSHGDCNPTVPIQESVNMLTKIHKRGDNAKLKICYGFEYNAWDVAHDGDELVEWFLGCKIT